MKNIFKMHWQLLFILMMTIGGMALVGCDAKKSADDTLAVQTEQSMQEANAQIGMPAIVNFQERKLMKQILELRDQENLLCYAYIKSEFSGKLIYIGKCIGYGLPYSVQFTNPERFRREYGHGYTIPQADPNGLFMPTGLSATWLMMVDPKTNEPRPVYIEPEIVVSPFLLDLGTSD